jgi:hypothetical protein
MFGSTINFDRTCSHARLLSHSTLYQTARRCCPSAATIQGHVGFVVDRVALAPGFHRVLRYPLPFFIPATAPHSFIVLSDALQSQSLSYVTTDGQSASLSWCQAPIWGPIPDFYYCQTVASL